MKTIKQNPLVVFFLLTFAIAWAMWIPAAMSKLSGGSSVLGPDNPLIGGLGRFAPGITAVLVMAALDGWRGIKDLVRPAGIWRVSTGWYVIALLFEPAIVLVSGWLDALLGVPAPPASLQNPTPYPILCVIPIMLIYSLPGAIGEELGWRGFALPGLQNKVSALIASTILGIAWGTWHIPLLVYYGQTGWGEILLSVVNTIPVCILFTWVYNGTRGSLLLVTLLHWSQQMIFSYWATPSWTGDALTWLVAIALVATQGMQLKRTMTEMSPVYHSST